MRSPFNLFLSSATVIDWLTDCWRGRECWTAVKLQTRAVGIQLPCLTRVCCVCRVRGPPSPLWPASQWAARRSTCWTSEPSSRSCLDTRSTPSWRSECSSNILYWGRLWCHKRVIDNCPSGPSQLLTPTEHQFEQRAANTGLNMQLSDMIQHNVCTDFPFLGKYRRIYSALIYCVWAISLFLHVRF